MNIKENTSRNAEVSKLFRNLASDHELSVAIVDLKKPNFEIFGFNMDKFIYPASMAKVFIAAEVLRQADVAIISLRDEVAVIAPNDVDKHVSIFHGDTRPLLCAGDRVTVEHLLNLMLSRSDNTATNCLIDLVGRESINENIINVYGWQGSEVTRKYLDRNKEPEKYQRAPVVMSCARHFAELFALIEDGRLVSGWVSSKLRYYMSQQHAYGIPVSAAEDEYLRSYSKGGWLETNLYKQSLGNAFKAIRSKGWAIIRWDSDAGFVELPTGERYIIVFFSVTKTIVPWKYFPVTYLKIKIMDYMQNS